MTNNGNTAMSEAQVSPVSEEEMNHVSKIFNRIAESIVQATSLGKDLDSIKAEVNKLQSDMDYQRQRNSELDSLVADVRRQRDEAESKLAEAAKEADQFKQTIASFDNQQLSLQHQLEALQAALASTRKDRDDASYKNLELQDEIKELKAFKAKFDNLVGASKPSNAGQSQPSPTKPYEAYNQPNQSPTRNW